MTVTLSDPTYVDRDYEVYNTNCPSCGWKLEWAIVTPPIPLTLYHWYDPNGEGQHIDECPNCEAFLPEGDLTKEATPV